MPPEERLQQQRIGTIRAPVVFSQGEFAGVPYHFFCGVNVA
jgi:hypothetical protein